MKISTKNFEPQQKSSAERHVAQKWCHKLIRLTTITFIPLRWINNVEKHVESACSRRT